MTGSSVSFTADGVPYTVTVPDTTVNFSPTATQATASYVNGTWVVTAPASSRVTSSWAGPS